MIEKKNVSVHSYRAIIRHGHEGLGNISDRLHAVMKATDVDVGVVGVKDKTMFERESACVGVRIQFAS
jgi:hypothetical protein